MKATMRRGGMRMFNVNVTFSVGRSQLIDVVRDCILDNRTPKNRREVFAAVRTAAHTYGAWLIAENATDEDIGLDGDEKRQAIRAAASLVDRLFPELKI